MAKCDFSAKFKVWALAEYMKAGGNPNIPCDKELATKAFTEVFNNVEAAVNEFAKMLPEPGPKPGSGSSYSGVIEINLDTDNIASYFAGGAGFMQMVSRFKKEMLATSVLDLDARTGEYRYIDSFGEGVVKNNILNYKVRLINSLRTAINDPKLPIITDLETFVDNNAYTTIVNETLNAFANYMEAGNKADIMASTAYTDFAILKNFDKLVKNYASYIEVDESFQKANLEGVEKYSFSPKVKHFTGFSRDEGADVFKQTSNLAETILSIACDVEENGNVLASPIGVSGFNGTMGTLKEALLYGEGVTSKEKARGYRNAYSRGADALFDKNSEFNILNFIDEFISKYKTEQKGVTAFDSFRQVYLHNKLRGIAKFLLSENTPAYVKNMFMQMFLKSEPTSYRAYSYDRDTGTFKGNNLRSRMQVTQKFAFQNVIKGGITLLNSDSRAFSKALTDKYSFKFSKSGSYETLDITDKNQRSLKLQYKVDSRGAHLISNATETVKLISEGDESLIKNIMRDAYSYIVPDTYKTCITGEKDFNENEDFAPFVAIAAQEALRNIGETKRGANFEVNGYDGKIDLSKYNAKLLEIGQRLGVIFGNSTKSTIKSLSGSTLPLFGLTSLEYNWRGCLDVAQSLGDVINDVTGRIEAINPWTNSFTGLNEEMFAPPQIRNDVECNDEIKNPNKMRVNELCKLGMIDDFFMPILENTGGSDDVMYFQNATFSDKARQFLIGLRLNTTFDKDFVTGAIDPIWRNSESKPHTLGEMISNALHSKTDLDHYSEFIRQTRQRRYSAIAYNILYKYAIAMPDINIDPQQILDYASSYDLESLVGELKKVDKYLVDNNLKIDDIRERFRVEGLDFIEESDATKNKVDSKVHINETTLTLMTAASTEENWNNRNAKNKEKFAADIATLHLNGFDRESKSQIDKIVKSGLFSEGAHKGFYNENTREFKFSDGKNLHALAEVYFYTDMFLTNEFNALTIGEIWAHPNKNKATLTTLPGGTYEEYSEASRLVNQVKRSVINGSTIHPFGQGVKDENGNYCGVTDKITIAVIEDNEGSVFTPLGVDSSLEAQDGSGWCTMLQSILENNSLIDAGVGENKKTILHDIDPLTGTPVLLKWAVYALSNSVRRNGQTSNVDVENLVRRAYGLKINADKLVGADLGKIYEEYKNRKGPVYIKDNINLTYKAVDRFEKIDNYNYKRVYDDGSFDDCTLAWDRGQGLSFTLYNIDQLFGGAFTYTNENGRFVGSEASQELLAATAITYDLRDAQVAYLVNKTAMKVGHRNLNKSEVWKNWDDFDTFKINTRFGGIMMNADHDLDEAEVTEMTQMISALIEDGNYPELVEQIYNSIGQIALNNDRVKQYVKAVNEKDQQKLRNIVGKSLIRSFTEDEKDTIGLANSFVRKYSKMLAENPDIDVDIPFSDATIFGAVVADVTSSLTKSGIRRKHPGLAGVLNPSNDMIMYYRIGGQNMMWEQANEKIASIFKEAGISMDDTVFYSQWGQAYPSSWVSATQYSMYSKNQEYIPSPGLVEISKNDIDFEDTIVVDGENIYVNDWKTYDKLKHSNFLDGKTFYKNEFAPRNLRGTDTKFTISANVNGVLQEVGTYSLYDIDSVRASFYVNELAGEKYTDYFNVFDQIVDPNAVAKYTLIAKVLGKSVEENFVVTKDLVDQCIQKTQEFLEKLDFGKEYTRKALAGEDNSKEFAYSKISHNSCFGEDLGLEYIATSYNVRPAEIIMGRYQLEKLGLDKGDQINEIKARGADYFKDKLSNLYRKPILPNGTDTIYDKVVYHNGEAYLVKLGRDNNEYPESDVQFSGAPEANIVGEDLRWNSQVILSGDNINAYRFSKVTDRDGNTYTLITIDEDPNNYENGETPLFDELLESDYFDDFYRNNDNNDNGSWLWKDYENYQSSESKRAEHFLNTMAKDRYETFTKAIQFIGARIPTQAMQSFMPFEVVCFTEDEQNKVYVPKANTHIEGSKKYKI